MTDPPTAVRPAKLQIGPVEMVVQVLEDGRRIVEAESLDNLFRWFAEGGQLTEAEAAELAKMMSPSQ